MGIIKAAINAVGGGLADSWLEVIEPSPMGDNTLICPGQLVSQNGKSVEKLTLGTEKNDGLAARLREIFGCEVTFE